MLVFRVLMSYGPTFWIYILPISSGLRLRHEGIQVKNFPPKRWYLPTNKHGVKTQKSNIDKQLFCLISNNFTKGNCLNVPVSTDTTYNLFRMTPLTGCGYFSVCYVSVWMCYKYNNEWKIMQEAEIYFITRCAISDFSATKRISTQNLFKFLRSQFTFLYKDQCYVLEELQQIFCIRSYMWHLSPTSHTSMCLQNLTSGFTKRELSRHAYRSVLTRYKCLVTESKDMRRRN
jgi:hypothetical protein